MAEKTVRVHLDRPRLVRRGGSAAAVEVGPGLATIPAALARQWGLQPYEEPAAQEEQIQYAEEPDAGNTGQTPDLEEQAAGEPFTGYDELNVDEITERLQSLSDEERAAVRAYEASHKARKGILGALEQ